MAKTTIPAHKPAAAPKPAPAVKMAGDNTGTMQPVSDAPRWAPPTSDEQFVFEGMDSAPAWVDPNWAGFDRGPALQLPAGDIYGKAPYTTVTARIGDTVVYTAAKGATAGKFTVIPGEPEVDSRLGTQKQAQVTNASLEDLLKTGNMGIDELGLDAAAQVAQRSPELKPMIEGNQPAPERQPNIASPNT